MRAIGRWSLTAAIVNGVVGSSIFAMPASVAGLVGARSPFAVLAAGVSIFIIVLCFAEVGSRFDEAGGPYLYTREAFGPLVGFQVGWLHVWTRLLSCAAVLNVLATHFGAMVPAAGTGSGRAITMIAATAFATLANIVGVRGASWATNVFTAAKLLPLVALTVIGGLRVRADVLATQSVSTPDWTAAVLLLVFAYGGFESGVTAASETKKPKRDMPFALMTAMAGVTILYAIVQLAVVGVLPRAAMSETPISSSLGELLGPLGFAIGNATVLVSAWGWLIGFALMSPRILYAMGTHGELPPPFVAVGPRYHTPYVAIAMNSLVALVMGLYSSFAGAATMAALAKLVIYGLTCAALPALRAQRGPAAFRVPGGRGVAFAGIVFCVWLLSTCDLTRLWLLAAIMAAGALLRGWKARGRFAVAASAP